MTIVCIEVMLHSSGCPSDASGQKGQGSVCGGASPPVLVQQWCSRCWNRVFCSRGCDEAHETEGKAYECADDELGHAAFVLLIWSLTVCRITCLECKYRIYHVICIYLLSKQCCFVIRCIFVDLHFLQTRLEV